MKKLIGILMAIGFIAGPASAQTYLGNMLGSDIHVAHLVRLGPTLPQKLATDHIAGSMGSMRDVSQGSYTVANPPAGIAPAGAFRYLTEGQQEWERGCSVLLLAPNYPTPVSAFVEHGDFNVPGGFAGFPNFNEGGYHLLSTPNVSFQPSAMPTTILNQGSSTKYVLKLVFKHRIDPNLVANYQANGIPDPEKFEFWAVSSYPISLDGMGNLVHFTGDTSDLVNGTKTGTVHYDGGFFSLAWAGDTANQSSKYCKMIDLNKDAALVGEHGGLISAEYSVIEMNPFTFTNVQTGAGTFSGSNAALKNHMIQLL